MRLIDAARVLLEKVKDVTSLEPIASFDGELIQLRAALAEAEAEEKAQAEKLSLAPIVEAVARDRILELLEIEKRFKDAPPSPGEPRAEETTTLAELLEEWRYHLNGQQGTPEEAIAFAHGYMRVIPPPDGREEGGGAERKLLNVVLGYPPQDHHPILADAIREYQAEMEKTVPQIVADVKRRGALADDARRRTSAGSPPPDDREEAIENYAVYEERIADRDARIAALERERDELRAKGETLCLQVGGAFMALVEAQRSCSPDLPTAVGAVVAEVARLQARVAVAERLAEALRAWERWYSEDSTEFNRDKAQMMGIDALAAWHAGAGNTKKESP